MPRCYVCKQTKPLGEFYTTRSRSTGVQAECKQCSHVVSSLSRKRHHDQFLSTFRKWRNLNREQQRTKMQAWRNENIEHRKSSFAAWCKANPDKRSAVAAKRRAAKLKATPTWANQVAIKSIYAQAASRGMHVDHIVPLNSPIVCGLHVEANLQLLPDKENYSKGNHHWPDMP